MPILEVMTSEPITVRPETTVEDLLNLFDRHDFNAFPVVAADGTLRGIVSKLDVLHLLHPDEQFRLPDPKTIAATPVSTIMRPGALTIEAEDPVVVAADLMVATGRRSLPVVKRGSGWPRLVGIVSRGDLLRGLRFELAKDAPRRVARASKEATASLTKP
jgi:CBS domain-containing protein